MQYLASVIIALLLITGCTTYTSDLPITKPYYRDQKLATEKKLELPPDLSLEISRALLIPDITNLNSLDSIASKYGIFKKYDQEDQAYHNENGKVWFELKISKKDVWERILSFWAAEGFALSTKDRVLGSLVTVWLENHNRYYAQSQPTENGNISQWELDSHRDRYLISLTPASRPGFIRVQMFHESMMLAEIGGEKRWIAQPSNQFYLNDMFARLVTYFSIDFVAKEHKNAVRGVLGLNRPFQFFQNEYAESYLVIPDTLHRTLFYFERQIKKLGHSISKESTKKFVNLSLSPCIAVEDNTGKNIPVCSLRITHANYNTLIIAIGKNGKNPSVAVSRNLFNYLIDKITRL